MDHVVEESQDGKTVLHITASTRKDWINAILFFLSAGWCCISCLDDFTNSTVPMADSFTSAAAFTGMWLMNKKKLENWTWWIITDLASIPLNFYKHLVFTSFQYVVFLILAVMGYITWRKKISACQLLKKIVVIGPESTGKSTLCEQLAAALSKPNGFLSLPGIICLEIRRPYTYEDLLYIARGQLALEDRICSFYKSQSGFHRYRHVCDESMV